LEGTDAWYLTTSLPLAARIDYKLIVDGQWILDPLNPAEAPSGFGPNSELSMPAWLYPSEIDFDASIPHGTIEGVSVSPGANYPPQSFSSTILNNTRNVWIYRPPNYNDQNQYPILYVHDGGEYIALAKMPNVLDNLIAAGEIEPLVVAFIDPVNRGPEYVKNQVPSFINLMVNELVPWVEAQVSVRGAAERGVMGTSNGGYISARLGRDHPAVFQKIASQSGALRADGGSLITSYASGVDVERVYLDTGYIADFIEANRSFRSVLESSNTTFTYAEYPEGHSWGLWRANLDELLRYLYPAL
jgi:enterochelin esterase family protein